MAVIKAYYSSGVEEESIEEGIFYKEFSNFVTTRYESSKLHPWFHGQESFPVFQVRK